MSRPVFAPRGTESGVVRGETEFRAALLEAAVLRVLPEIPATVVTGEPDQAPAEEAGAMARVRLPDDNMA